MQLSFNLIKGKNASVNGDKSIKTQYVEINNEENVMVKSAEENMLKSYELLGSNIIRKARNDAEKIVVEAMQKAKEIEKEAYEKGYMQGKTNGYEDGSKEGYSKAIQEGNAEISQVIDKAHLILANVQIEYDKYMALKKREILELALEMAKVISAKEFEKDDSLLNLIEPIMEEAKGEENIIIRCNGNYIDSIKERVSYWKNAYAIKGEIFVLEDPIMDLGKAVIEKNTGRTIVDMDIALERIEAVLKEQFVGGNND